MRHLVCSLSFLTLLATILFGAQAPPPADTAFYAVSYVELMPSARAAAVAAFKAYREASSKDAGYVRIEFFEQVGWPGHFVVLERWMDASAFDAHTKAPYAAQLQTTLQPIRVSGYDQRPYKTLTVVAGSGSAGDGAVFVVSHVDIGGGPQGDAPGMLRKLAESSRKEGGNLRFDVLQHNVRANHFTVVEGWRSQKDHDTHAAAAHTRQYRDVLQPMTGSPLDERLYKAVN